MPDFIQHFFSGVPYFFRFAGFDGMGSSNIYLEKSTTYCF